MPRGSKQLGFAFPRVPPKSIAAVRSQLLTWFKSAQRDLPWRRTKDAYAIWVSEVMLQQTQVDRVRLYWAAFLRRFPSVEVLASASPSDVLEMWKGLGYYSRARNLHRAAQEIVDRFSATLPASVEALKSLPGFGPYTAGAVASIAYEVDAPIVDGNVARVLSRVFLIDAIPGDPQREKTLWFLAGELVRGHAPGELNQSLMELGALVCTPASPSCTTCPVSSHCQAHQCSREGEIPPPKPPTRRKRLELSSALAMIDDKVLLARRAEKGLFGGLWELPSIERKKAESTHDQFQRLLGPQCQIKSELAHVERTLTHRDLSISVIDVFIHSDTRLDSSFYIEWRWVGVHEIKSLAMSSAMVAAFAQATENRSEIRSLAAQLAEGVPVLGEARPKFARRRSPSASPARTRVSKSSRPASPQKKAKAVL